MPNIHYRSSVSNWNGLGLYKFPTSLTVSNDNAIEAILADIPFFAVGLLSFGAFTFFLAMKRFNILSAILHASVLLAFIASILDLSQILQRGRTNTNKGAGLQAVSGLLVARELGFAISVGLRFLFFWLFVAVPPRGEKVTPIPSDAKANISMFSFREPNHSGAWGRWGIPGLILKWSILAITFIIGVLQIVWRIVPNDNRLGGTYGAEATMEIVTSALFILKLLLNSSITTVAPRSKVLRGYSAMIVALLINFGLGIGNVATFAFSESTLGRFLQAVEFYIIILFVLISSFYHYGPMQTPDSAKSKLPVEYTPEPKRGSTFRISPFPPTPNPLAPVDPVYQQEQERSVGRPTILSRPSTSVSGISSWIVARRPSKSRSAGGDQVRLWDQGEAEKGESSLDRRVINSGRVSPYSYDSAIDLTEELENSESSDPMAATMMNDPAPEPMGRAVSRWTMTTINSRRESTNEEPLPNNTSSSGILDPDSLVPPDSLLPPRNPNAASNAYSFGSYYGSDVMRGSISNVSSVAGLQSRIDSPIYGLNGIVERPVPGRQLPGSAARARSSALSFTELLRQQTELDKSIAALRLFSPQQESMRESRRYSIGGSFSPGGTKQPNRSNSSIGMPSSMKSEFSLSIFPEPPETIIPSTTSAPAIALKVRPDNDNRRSRFMQKAEGIAGLPLPRMPALNDEYPNTPQSVSSIPGSLDVVNPSRAGKIDSAGTQYDVTSFIGNLTTPGIKNGGTFDRMTDIASEDGISELNASEMTDTTTMVVEVPNAPTSTAAVRPVFMNAESAFPPTGAFPVTVSASTEHWSGPAAIASSDIMSAQTQAGAESAPGVPNEPLPPMKSAPALQNNVPSLRSAPVPRSRSSKAPTHARKISAKVLPSLSVSEASNSQPNPQQNPAPYLSTGGNVVGASEGELEGKRRPPPGRGMIGLPARPRLAISGPRPPPLDGKGDQGPSAFERPRPPPLILRQPNTRTSENNGKP